jgi:small subunit ribosomal protein S17
MPVKQQIGIVISNKMQKTIVVKLKTDIHIQYSKTLKLKVLSSWWLEQCNIGDQVLVQECRPLSKRKRWKLIEILSKSSLIS